RTCSFSTRTGCSPSRPGYGRRRKHRRASPRRIGHVIEQPLEAHAGVPEGALPVVLGTNTLSQLPARGSPALLALPRRGGGPTPRGLRATGGGGHCVGRADARQPPDRGHLDIGVAAFEWSGARIEGVGPGS